MSTDIAWTTGARRDLNRIVNYFDDVDPRVADRLLDAVDDAVAALAENPMLGSIAGLGTNGSVRALRIKPYYALCYQLRQGKLFIVRLWDTRRSPRSFAIDE